MPAAINYKSKYLELRSKYIADLDMAFRLGIEQGAKQAQEQQAIDAQAQAQEMEMQQQNMQAGGQETQPGQPGQESAPSADPTNQGGSELDQHISKLEGMLGSNPEPEIQKSLQAIVSLRKSEKEAIEMKKSELAIKGIAKALHKPAFKIGVQAAHNMADSAKRAVTLQHKIVSDVMKAWKEEESKASKDIKNILDIEGLVKE